MIMTILLLKIIGLAWLITTFAPLQWVLETLPNNIFKYIIVLLTTCIKCCSFWTGLIIGGIWIGILAAAIAALTNEILIGVKHLWIKYLNKKRE